MLNLIFAVGALYSGGCAVVYFHLSVTSFAEALDRKRMGSAWLGAATGSGLFCGFAACVVASAICCEQLLKGLM